MTTNENKTEKLLDKSPMSGIAVPVAIVLVGALIIFGVTRMLSNGKGYRDLVDDLNSKTFGNRWIAAFELSKYLNGNQIDEADLPWLKENLSQIYTSSIDPRTRNFVILALGSLKDESIVPTLNKALEDEDPKVVFSALTSMANIGALKDDKVSWTQVEKIMNGNDALLSQASLLLAAQNKKVEARENIRQFLSSENVYLRFAAATGLIYFSDYSALPTLEKILSMTDKDINEKLNGAQIEQLKLNVIGAIEKNKASEFIKLLSEISSKDENIKVSTRAQKLLNVLKN